MEGKVRGYDTVTLVLPKHWPVVREVNFFVQESHFCDPSIINQVNVLRFMILIGWPMMFAFTGGKVASARLQPQRIQNNVELKKAYTFFLSTPSFLLS